MAVPVQRLRLQYLDFRKQRRPSNIQHCPPLAPPAPHPQALQRRGPITDPRAEKQVVALLSTPLDKYDVVTGESDDNKCFLVCRACWLHLDVACSSLAEA